MTIAATNLTANRDSTDATSYTTASVSPTGNDLIIVAVFNSKGSTPDTPTISGGGVTTWTQVATHLRGTASRLTVFRGVAPASPTPATIVIDFAGATQTSCAWSVDDFSGCDTGGTNGSNAIVQEVDNDFAAATSASNTLAAFGSASNATYGTFAHTANESTTAGTGFTRMSDVFGASPANALIVEFRSDNDTSVDASWATSVNSIGIAIELAAAAAGTTVTPSEVAVVLATQAPTITSDTTVTGLAAVGLVLQPRTPAVSTPAGNGSYPAHLIQFAPGIASSAVPSSGDWVDITTKVFEWATKWGTEDEFTQPAAGDGDLLLDNSGGLFDPDNSSGTYFGNLLPGMWFRIDAGTTTADTDVFYGQVTQDGFQVGASQHPDTVVRVRLVDVSEFLNNVDAPSSVYEIEVNADTPALWWRLNESSGTTATDASGNGRHGTYTGGATFNATTGLLTNDPNGAINFDGSDDRVRLDSITLGATWGMEFKVKSNTSTTNLVASLEDAAPSSSSTGTISVGKAVGSTKLSYSYVNPAAATTTTYESTAAVFDGSPHSVFIVQSGATTSLYVDGVEGKTLTAGAAVSVTRPPMKLTVAGLYSDLATQFFNGVIDEFVLYTSAPSAARVLAHYQAGSAPWGGDLSSGRVTRILDLVDYDATQRNINTGNSTMQPVMLDNSAWNIILDTAKAENGVVYVDHQDGGKVRFIDRHHRWSATASLTSQVTIGDGGGAEVPATAIDLVDDRIINRAEMESRGGTAVVTQDSASQTTYRQRSLTEKGLLYVGDNESTYRGERVVAEKKDRHRRPRSVTLEPRKSTHPAWAHVFARKLNDRITVTWRPTYGGTRTYIGWIIGIAQRWTAASGLTTTFWLAPVPFDTAAEPYWIAGVSTAGVTTRPGY